MIQVANTEELGLAFPKVGEGGKRQGSPQRFGPTSNVRGERTYAAIQEALERGQNTGHTKSFSIT